MKKLLQIGNLFAGTVVTACISFFVEMDSLAFRVLATGLMLIMFALYFANWFFILSMPLWKASVHIDSLSVYQLRDC